MAKNDEQTSYLKSRHRKKVLKYLKHDDRSKLKHFIRKHSVDIDSADLGDGDRVIHKACYWGAESIIRWVAPNDVQKASSGRGRRSLGARWALSTWGEGRRVLLVYFYFDWSPVFWTRRSLFLLCDLNLRRPKHSFLPVTFRAWNALPHRAVHAGWNPEPVQGQPPRCDELTMHQIVLILHQMVRAIFCCWSHFFLIIKLFFFFAHHVSSSVLMACDYWKIE